MKKRILSVSEMENKNTEYDFEHHAHVFIKEVLKLGSKQNILDAYLRKNKIPEHYLYEFINAVIDELDKKWR